MSGGPTIELELVTQNVAPEQWLNVDVFAHQQGEVVLEQIRVDIAILIRDHVLDHEIQCRRLIVLKSYVEGGSVDAVFLVVGVNPSDFVEYRELVTKIMMSLLFFVVLDPLLQEGVHALTIEAQNGDQIAEIKLQE